MGVKGKKRSWSSISPCFGTSDRRKSWWLRLRAKKRTAPVDATIEVDVAEKNMDDKEETIKPSKVSAAKGFFKRFHKDKSIAHTTKGKESSKSSASHVSSCNSSQIPTVTLLQLLPAQKEIKINQKRLSPIKPNHPRNNNKKKKVDVRDGLVVLAATLVTILLGGRMVAIACMSAWFYILPYFDTTNMKNCERNKSIHHVDISSQRYVKRVVLQDSFGRNRQGRA